MRLVPMERGHIDGLLAVANQDRTTFTFTPVPWDGPSMTDYVDSALAQPGRGHPLSLRDLRKGRRSHPRVDPVL